MLSDSENWIVKLKEMRNSIDVCIKQIEEERQYVNKQDFNKDVHVWLQCEKSMPLYLYYDEIGDVMFGNPTSMTIYSPDQLCLQEFPNIQIGIMLDHKGAWRAQPDKCNGVAVNLCKEHTSLWVMDDDGVYICDYQARLESVLETLSDFKSLSNADMHSYEGMIQKLYARYNNNQSIPSKYL